MYSLIGKGELVGKDLIRSQSDPEYLTYLFIVYLFIMAQTNILKSASKSTDVTLN